MDAWEQQHVVFLYLEACLLTGDDTGREGIRFRAGKAASLEWGILGVFPSESPFVQVVGSG